MKLLVNRDLIADRMHTLALSERQVMGRISMPQFAFRDLRRNGVLHGHINVRQLDELGRALGLSPGALLASGADDEPAADINECSDVELLIPALAASPQPFDISRLARALEWDRARLSAVLETIPAALAGTGMELIRSGGTVAIRSAGTIDPELRRRLAAAHAGVTALNTTQARALFAIHAGDQIALRNLGNADRVALGVIKNQGCIELDEAGQYRLTATMRLALALD